MKKATCTWGDGPDVLLTIENDTFILYEDPKHLLPPHGDYAHGYVTRGSMDLTIDEALALSIQLKSAAEKARFLETMVMIENIPPETLTCYKCNQRDKCKYVDDAYNTDGDCLAMK
jgi:hypothetical protein